MMREHAAKLADASFGPVMLKAVGFGYENVAEQHLGSLSRMLANHFNPMDFFSSQYALVKERTHFAKTRYDALASVFG
eukprot:6336314-Pyramimonas_sp.AAC.1